MWNTIIGHAHPRALLQKAIEEDKLPHAYLFVGQRGIGKCSLAFIAAKTLFCTSPPSPCGTCTACQRVDHGTHPDVHFLTTGTTSGEEKKSSQENIVIDDIRELRTKLQLYPLEGKAKIAIIDDAHRMTESAANALLKILEEPPAATHFILITHSLHHILPTIRSRCQIIPFSPLPIGAVARWLTTEKGLADAEALKVAELSEGSLGTALAYDAPFVAATSAEFAALSSDPRPSALLTLAERWSRDAEKTRAIVELLARCYRDRLLEAALGKAAHASCERAHRGVMHLVKARNALETPANKQLLFEELLFNLAALERR